MKAIVISIVIVIANIKTSVLVCIDMTFSLAPAGTIALPLSSGFREVESCLNCIFPKQSLNIRKSKEVSDKKIIWEAPSKIAVIVE